jgi:N-alpha-acetyl-L-2,4-diaminobutyrate deacetylase
VSPIDHVNLNRAFPGKPDGTVTEIIADYFSRTLVPMADYVLDIHSGGKTLDCLPFAASHVLNDKKQERACELAAKAFEAPYLLKMLELDAGGMYDTQVESMGKIFVTTELGGGGTASPETIEIAKRGIDNFLIYAKILARETKSSVLPTVSLSMPDEASLFAVSIEAWLNLFLNWEMLLKWVIYSQKFTMLIELQQHQRTIMQKETVW